MLPYPAYAGTAERKQYEAAEESSMFHFWGGRQPTSSSDALKLTMSGPLADVDLSALGTVFDIPIYFVEGEHDMTAPRELARAYFDNITAPEKEFHLVTGCGHVPRQATIDLMRSILLEKVAPLARRKIEPFVERVAT